MVASEADMEDVMRKVWTLFLLVGAAVTGMTARAQTAAAPSWADPATWRAVKPIETDNIVYRNAPLIHNPSANPDPGTPGGIRAPLPNTAAPGTIDLHVDLYQVPSAKPVPVVVQIHGGGWIRGDRPNGYGTFRALLAAGMSVVTVQYRNAKDAPAPAAIEDVRCAMAWVKANAAKYNFDLGRVVLYGASAGGHLAQIAAYGPASFNPPGCTDQPKVAAVLDFYGVTDVVKALGQHGSADSVHQWLGLETPLPKEPGATANGRPQPTRWPAPTAEVLARAKELSPVQYIGAKTPPTFIVNGDRDPSVDPSQDAELKAALDAAHVPNGQDIIAGGGHGNFPPAEADKAMLLCLEFLKANGVL
jgi:acetyl esterase/lipase